MTESEKRKLIQELSLLYKIDLLDVSSVFPGISPEEQMFIHGHERHYFSVGFSGLLSIIQTLSCARRNRDEIRAILDFASGGGRVLRFIKAYFPEAEITAAEIDTNLLRFLQENLAVRTVQTNEDLDRIDIDQKYDLIWCGSLITHLTKRKTKQLLEFFCSALNNRGILVMTTHGRWIRKILSHNDTAKERYGLSAFQGVKINVQYETTGFGYGNYKGERGYGISIIKPSWIVGQLERNDEWRILFYKEKCWDNHQDVIACEKRGASDCAASLTADWRLHIPVIVSLHASLPGIYWAELVRVLSDTDGEIFFKVINYGDAPDARIYENCQAATLSADLKLQIPELILNYSEYWCILRSMAHSHEKAFVRDSLFRVEDYGQNVD